MQVGAEESVDCPIDGFECQEECSVLCTVDGDIDCSYLVDRIKRQGMIIGDYSCPHNEEILCRHLKDRCKGLAKKCSIVKAFKIRREIKRVLSEACSNCGNKSVKFKAIEYQESEYYFEESGRISLTTTVLGSQHYCTECGVPVSNEVDDVIRLI